MSEQHDPDAAFESEVTSIDTQVRTLRAQGLTGPQIRARLPGVSQWAVNCAINRDSRALQAHPGLRSRAKDADRDRARTLRLAGKTYKQIRAEIRVSNSTLSLWLRDLPYPKPDRAAHATHMNRVRTQRNTERRVADKARAEAEIGHLTDRELFILGVGLYWAEGAKDKPYHRRESTVFINSDPGVIRVYLAWLDILGIEQARRRYRLSIHETADVAAAEDYWRSIICSPDAEFSRATLKRHNPKTVRKRVGDDYHGCLIVTVLRSSELYRRIEGWWRGIVEARRMADVRDWP